MLCSVRRCCRKDTADKDVLGENFMVKSVPQDEYSIFEKFSKKLLLGCYQEMSSLAWEERLLHEFPVQKSSCRSLPTGEISISIALEQPQTPNVSRGLKSPTLTQNRTLIVDIHSSIDTVISQIIKKLKERGESLYGPEHYMLKLADREEFLVSSSWPIELIRFKYIEDCVLAKKTAELVLIPKKAIENLISHMPRMPRCSRVDPPLLGNVNENSFKDGLLSKREFIYTHDLWKRYSKMSCALSYQNKFEISAIANNNNVSNELDLSIQLDDTYQPEDLIYSITVTKIDLQNDSIRPKDQKIIVIMGLYHGKESLCERQYKEYKDGSCSIFFPIEIWNLPRMARLCFGLMLVKQTVTKDYADASQRKYLGWGNLMLYDHMAILKSKTATFNLWPSNKQALNPTGSVYGNPDGRVIAPEITMELLPTMRKFRKIIYPPKEILIQEAGRMIGNEAEVMPSEEEKRRLQEILLRSPMDDIMEDEQEILWRYRYYIRDYFQDSLPKMLNTKPWNNFVNVAKMHHLACGWPIENDVVFALELLGPDSVDSDIRMMAVESLQRLSWHEFSRYLLQICQCLKYESYLNSNFIQMFLKRMTQNAKIAQSIFYYMKVEMSACEWSKVTFSIILYNYLQYSPIRGASLLRQNTATAELCQLNKALMLISTLEGEKKAQCLSKFRDTLSLPENREIFDNLPCPIDPNIILKVIEPQRCKFMDSKMRPIRLLWRVNESFKKEYSIIYKNGDDLRQDALIVQMLHIMDSIWHTAGLDLKLNPYEVLACSKTEGYIQVVQNAETLANIFKSDRNKKRKLFYDWLKQNSHIDMSIVVQNFTRSCAAYCVATFVLGIGDRHSDNIMITTEGHLFHIDFGHILGNFKKIMGGMVSREWTKFILVQDFLDVVGNGEHSDAKEQEFKSLCCEGYIALRKHSNLILSLFKMMINADIPEISSLDDLNYLKETLQIGKTESDARAYFHNVYNDTRKKEMFVSLNWVAHTIRRNNN